MELPAYEGTPDKWVVRFSGGKISRATPVSPEKVKQLTFKGLTHVHRGQGWERADELVRKLEKEALHAQTPLPTELDVLTLIKDAGPYGITRDSMVNYLLNSHPGYTEFEFDRVITPALENWYVAGTSRATGDSYHLIDDAEVKKRIRSAKAKARRAEKKQRGNPTTGGALLKPKGHKRGCQCVVCGHARSKNTRKQPATKRRNHGYENQMLGPMRRERKALAKKRNSAVRIPKPVRNPDNLNCIENPSHYPPGPAGRPGIPKWWILDLYGLDGKVVATSIEKATRTDAAAGARARAESGKRAHGHVVNEVTLSGPYPRKPSASTERK